MKRLMQAAAMVGVLGFAPVVAQAQMAVVDVRAIFELRQQINYWRQQITSMQQELAQLQATHSALTGIRGLQNLLPLSLDARNYLPADWSAIRGVLAGQGGRHAALAGDLAGILQTVSLLTEADLSRRSPRERAAIEEGRSQAAWLAATSRSAYAQASARFGSLQQLIVAVGQVTDAKAAADLQARIAAEQAMLANEQAKLELLAQMSRAEEALQAQRQREAVIAAHGQFAARFQPVTP